MDKIEGYLYRFCENPLEDSMWSPASKTYILSPIKLSCDEYGNVGSSEKDFIAITKLLDSKVIVRVELYEYLGDFITIEKK